MALVQPECVVASPDTSCVVASPDTSVRPPTDASGIPGPSSPRSAAGVTNRFIGEKDQVCNFFILMDTINDVYSHAPGNLPPSPSPPSTRLREGRARNRGNVQRLLGWWRRRQKIA